MASSRVSRDVLPLVRSRPSAGWGWIAETFVEFCAPIRGGQDAEPATWPKPAREAEAAESERWSAAIRGLTRRVRATTSVTTTELLLVVVDLPYAAVRRYLSDGRPIPADLEGVVAGIVRSSLR